MARTRLTLGLKLDDTSSFSLRLTPSFVFQVEKKRHRHEFYDCVKGAERLKVRTLWDRLKNPIATIFVVVKHYGHHKSPMP
jgi:hypothetical protein